MKKNLLLALLVVTSIGYSQHYQSIKSNQIHYFGTQEDDYFLATRTDSVQLDGADSVFYSYRSLRGVIDGSCLYRIGPAWTGEKIIIREDGTNLFFNQDADTIFIATQAALNDTFTVYQYPDGELIRGTVTDISAETILGEPDSVKTIQLFTDHPDFDLEEAEIRIGKNAGFVNVFPFYSFPGQYYPAMGKYTGTISRPVYLAGDEATRTGITKRTKGEIFDHEIGDEINYRKSSSNPVDLSGLTISHLIELDVLDRTDWGTDSAQYVFSRKNRTRETSFEFPGLDSETIGAGEVTVTYYDLDEYLNPYLPEEFRLDEMDVGEEGVGAARMNTMRLSQCGRIEERVHEIFDVYLGDLGGPVDLDSDCLNMYTLGMSTLETSYWEGVGGNYFTTGFFYDGWGQDWGGALLWVSDEDGDCGENFFIGLAENEKIDPLNVYPNPANDLVAVQLAIHQPTAQLIINNLAGKQIHVENVNAESLKTGYQLDIAQLPSGIYTLTIATDEQHYHQRMVKN